MTLAVRVIPCLDVDAGRVVKGVNFQELRDAGGAVVSLHELTGRTKGSGIPMTMRIGAVVSKFADGRIGAQRLFPSWESALEAAGLSE